MSLPETNLRVDHWVFGIAFATLGVSLAIVSYVPSMALRALLLVAAHAGAAGVLWWQISRALIALKDLPARAERDLAPLRAALVAVRAGDLTARAQITEGPLAPLAQQLDQTLEALGELVGQLAAAASEVTASTEHIERFCEVLAERSGRQSTAIAEVARKLTGVGARSEEVGQIVELLEDVAAETNILALNAAIEASRAGTQGKGFGMVADEVRKLAERSAAATKDIGAFIHGIETTTDDASRTIEEIRGLGDTVLASATQATAAAAAISSAGRTLTEVLLPVRLPGQDETDLARALRDRRVEIARALEGLTPLVQEARTPLGEALRQVLAVLAAEGAVARPMAPSPGSSSDRTASISAEQRAPATGTG